MNNMNRQKKRVAKAKARGQAADRTVAAHEAGHVVARILVAESLGWPADENVSHVDIHPTPVATGAKSIDAKHELLALAVTYGQMLSQPMSEFLKAKFG